MFFNVIPAKAGIQEDVSSENVTSGDDQQETVNKTGSSETKRQVLLKKVKI